MLSNEFFDYLTSYPHIKSKFDGIFSADNLPKKIVKGRFIICNTDYRSGPGKHWYCVLKLEKDSLECFDSLGIDSEKKTFITNQLRLKGIKRIHFNTTCVQSLVSTSCGHFVLYFIVHRYYNQDLDFDELMNTIFVESPLVNEEKVAEFFAHHFQIQNNV